MTDAAVDVLGAKKPKVRKEKMSTSVVEAAHSPKGRLMVYALALLWTLPGFGFLVSSFRNEKSVKTTGWWTAFVKPGFTFNNYKSVLSSGDSDLWTFFFNSLRIVVPSVFISVAVAAIAAYAFSWIRFPGRDFLYSFVLSMLVVPLQMGLIPLLRLITGGAHLTVFGKTLTVFPYLHLNGTVMAVWIAHTIYGLPFCVFLLKGTIGGLPGEIIEAARVDGASHFKIFRTVIIPLAMPAIVSVFIFQFVYIWNDYLIGRVFGGSDNAPLTAKLVDVAGEKGQAWHLLTAAGVVSTIVPLIVFFSLQKFFVKGLLAGSVKG